MVRYPPSSFPNYGSLGRLLKPEPPPISTKSVTIAGFADLLFQFPDLAPEVTPEVIKCLRAWGNRAGIPYDVSDLEGRNIVMMALFSKVAHIAKSGTGWTEGGSLIVRGGRVIGFESHPSRLTRRDEREINLITWVTGLRYVRSWDWRWGVLLTWPGAGHPDLDAIDLILSLLSS